MPSFKFIKFTAEGDTEYYLAAAPEGTDNYGWILYREEGPAVIKADGTQEFYANGVKHRLDAPSVVSPNGYQEFWTNGHLGRKDGPAIIYEDGNLQIVTNGIEPKQLLVYLSQSIVELVKQIK